MNRDMFDCRFALRHLIKDRSVEQKFNNSKQANAHESDLLLTLKILLTRKRQSNK